MQYASQTGVYIARGSTMDVGMKKGGTGLLSNFHVRRPYLSRFDGQVWPSVVFAWHHQAMPVRADRP
ncbi:hypothetical protein HOE425_290092 [Hoeflea sp. EC-HK425]|nr:hypothetical protein HOE425_290092 [Hoeflea sp. EC-HK425]